MNLNPGPAMRPYALADPQVIGLCVDTLQIDTVYMDNAAGEEDMMIQKYPLAPWEF